MMTKMREMTVVGLWILVIAFLGMMVLQWGADIGRGGGRSNVVGEVDGVKIKIDDFEAEVEGARDAEVSKSGKSPDYERIKQIRDEVWERTVQRILLKKELKKYNIQVTDHEVAEYIYNNPLPFLQQNEAFQTEGKFDLQKYHDAVLNPPNPQAWLPVENYIKENLPYQKLQQYISSAAAVTEEELLYEYKRRYMEAQLEYIYIPVSAFTVDSLEVSEDDIKNYYEENKEDFKVEEKRKLNYVLFSTAPTARDSSRTYELAQEMLGEAKKGADFAKLADEYSEDPSVQQNHGDLGYFEKSAMVAEFSEAAFSTPVGQITGPVKTRFGLHIIKVIDKKTEDGKEKVRASHILLKFNASASTIEDANAIAQNFYESAKEDGFQVVADQLKYEVKQTTPFARKNYIPGFGAMASTVNWAFENDVNDISRVYRTQQGYAVFQISEIQPAGYKPFEEVRNVCKSRVEFQKRMDKAHSFAEKLRPLVEGDSDFKGVIEKDTSHIAIYDTTAKFKFDQPIPKIGKAPELMAAAFLLPLNTTSDLLKSRRGYFYIQVLYRTPFDEKNYETQKKGLKQQLLAQKRQKIFEEWYTYLKEQADIKDNRDLFYRG